MSSIKTALVNLRMHEGVDFQADFAWEIGEDNAAPEGVDLTGWNGVMDIRLPGGIAPLARLTIANGKLVFADQAEILGGWGIDLPGADSQGWCPAHIDVRAEYELILYDPAGGRYMPQHGEIIIEAATTRPWEV